MIDFVAFEPADAEAVIACRDVVGVYVLISTDSVYMACAPSAFERRDGRLLRSL